jgi:hypothetical protein
MTDGFSRTQLHGVSQKNLGTQHHISALNGMCSVKVGDYSNLVTEHRNKKLMKMGGDISMFTRSSEQN